MMSKSEIVMLDKYLSKSKKYMEFGSGGSTVLAKPRVSNHIVSVDSSSNWIDTVQKECHSIDGVPVQFIHADIGRTKDLGYPVDNESENCKNYHSSVWKHVDVNEFDLFLIDGRFRVACAMQILKRCRDDSIILFHDYSNRPFYHIVSDYAVLIEEAERLTAFRPKTLECKEILTKILNEFSMDAR